MLVPSSNRSTVPSDQFPQTTDCRSQYPHCVNSIDYDFGDNDYNVILFNHGCNDTAQINMTQIDDIENCLNFTDPGNMFDLALIYQVSILIISIVFVMKSMQLQMTSAIIKYRLIKPMHVSYVVRLDMILLVFNI